MKMWSGSETKLCTCYVESQFGIKIFALKPWILISFFIFSFINFPWMITALKDIRLGKIELKIEADPSLMQSPTLLQTSDSLYSES